MEGERCIGVVEVPDPHVVDRLRVMQLQDVSVVRKPSLVPVVDPVKVARVVVTVFAGGNGAQVFGLEHVKSGDSLQMDGVVIIVSPEGSGCKEWHGLVEEASVRRGVRHVGAEVDCRGVDLGIGGHVRNGGEEEVHHAGVVCVVDDRSVES